MGYFKHTYKKLVSPPGQEPITLAEAKKHLRVVHTHEDELIETLITLAREEFERLTGRVLISQQWKIGLEDFPATGDCDIYVPAHPLISVDSLVYEGTTWDAANYSVDLDSVPPRIRAVSTWPVVSVDSVPSPVVVTYTAGHGTAPTDIPDKAPIQAIKLLISHYYENRIPVSTGSVAAVEIPETTKALIWRCRLWYQ